MERLRPSLMAGRGAESRPVQGGVYAGGGTSAGRRHARRQLRWTPLLVLLMLAVSEAGAAGPAGSPALQDVVPILPTVSPTTSLLLVPDAGGGHDITDGGAGNRGLKAAAVRLGPLGPTSIRIRTSGQVLPRCAPVLVPQRQYPVTLLEGQHYTINGQCRQLVCRRRHDSAHPRLLLRSCILPTATNKCVPDTMLSFPDCCERPICPDTGNATESSDPGPANNVQTIQPSTGNSDTSGRSSQTNEKRSNEVNQTTDAEPHPEPEPGEAPLGQNSTSATSAPASQAPYAPASAPPAPPPPAPPPPASTPASEGKKSSGKSEASGAADTEQQSDAEETQDSVTESAASVPPQPGSGVDQTASSPGSQATDSVNPGTHTTESPNETSENSSSPDNSPTDEASQPPTLAPPTTAPTPVAATKTLKPPTPTQAAPEFPADATPTNPSPVHSAAPEPPGTPPFEAPITTATPPVVVAPPPPVQTPPPPPESVGETPPTNVYGAPETPAPVTINHVYAAFPHGVAPRRPKQPATRQSPDRALSEWDHLWNTVLKPAVEQQNSPVAAPPPPAPRNQTERPVPIISSQWRFLLRQPADFHKGTRGKNIREFEVRLRKRLPTRRSQGSSRRRSAPRSRQGRDKKFRTWDVILPPRPKPAGRRQTGPPGSPPRSPPAPPRPPPGARHRPTHGTPPRLPYVAPPRPPPRPPRRSSRQSPPAPPRSPPAPPRLPPAPPPRPRRHGPRQTGVRAPFVGNRTRMFDVVIRPPPRPVPRPRGPVWRP